MRDLTALPKAHLHLHLDGAIRREIYVELTGRHGLDGPLPSGYGSFAHFTATITAAAACLRDEETVTRVMTEIASDAAGQGVVWLELSVWPGLFCGRLGPHRRVVEVLLDAAQETQRVGGAGVGIIVAANRDRGAEEAAALAHLAGDYAGGGVVGFALDGDETAGGPREFVGAFAIARAAGLVRAPHAGELCGPASVLDAIELLDATRIMHGVRAIEDDSVVALLADRGICLDVCPTSNVMLSVYSSISDHPLARLLEAGVPCSVGADDPLLFGTDILQEYERCRTGLAMSDDTLAQVARMSITASAAPASIVEPALQRIDAWRADLPA